MSNSPMVRAWLYLAVIYFVVGVLMGVVMGASGNHVLRPVHAHVNLLGWVSMALFAVIGTLYPAVTSGRLATVQFWLYNIAVPVMAVSLSAKMLGHAGADPVLGISSTAAGVAVLLYALQVFGGVKAARAG